MGIEVLLPDVNESFVEFAVVPDKQQIRFGMAAVKGVGVAAVEEVLRARDTDGKFKNIEDFARRVSTRRFNRKAWESLIKSGGFDSFGDRSDLLFNLDTIIAFASKVQKEALSGQTDLFGMLGSEEAGIQATMNLATSPAKHTDKERLTWERELMGLFISSHPLDNYDAYFEEQTIPLSRVGVDIDGKKVTIGGLVSSVRTIITKSGTKMAFVKIEDKTTEAEIVVFPNLFEQIGAKLVQDAVVRITGKVNARDRDGNLRSEVSIIADELIEVSDEELRTYESTGRKMQAPKMSAQVKARRVAEYKAKKSGTSLPPNTPSRPAEEVKKPALVIAPEIPVVKKLFVNIKDPDDHESLHALRQVCAEFGGSSDIVLVLGAEKKSAIKLPFKVEASDALIGRLVKLLGEDCVVLK